MSSRLIVRNLPKYVTAAELKEKFSEKGVVTDVQLKYTKDGKFRRFGFIGFKTEDEAADALKHFNNTYINTSRITVEYCVRLGDVSKPKSWSKYAPDSKINEFKQSINDKSVKKKKSKKEKTAVEESENVKENEETERKKGISKKNIKIAEIIKKHKDDPLFTEFIESHTKGTKQSWSNDTSLGLNGKDNNFDEKESNYSEKNESNYNSKCSDEDEKEEETIAKKNISDKEYMEVLKKKSKGLKDVKVIETKKQQKNEKFFTIKVRGLAHKHKKKDVKIIFKDMKPKSIRVPRNIKHIAYVGFKTNKQMKQALTKHKSFYDGHRIFVSVYEDEKESNQGEVKNFKLRWNSQEDALKHEETIAESGRIFLRNLAYTTKEEDIQATFEKYGPLTEVNLPIDKDTRALKGFGTVTFLMPEHAVKAYTELDGSVQNGRMLHLLPAKTRISPENLLSHDGLSYKQKKELQLKATAASSHNWNTLFLGQNAIADAIAKTYNTTKENVLQDSDKGSSVAVRLALGETQLVQETQKFLEENGVCLTAFNQLPKARSKTVIVAKNLPAGTSAEEIRELFVKFGVLDRVVLPPSGITALVEFVEPFEARKAFTKLAYSKFKTLPLYLEWAPDDSFTSPRSSVKTDKDGGSKMTLLTSVKENKLEKSMEIKQVIGDDKKSDDEDEDDDPEPDTTLFVKNLNFNTSEEQLKKHFEKCGRLHYATISTKKDPKNPKNKLSMGYGFVRYKYKSNAEKALKELQMSTLDGKTLELKRSERTLETDVKTTKKSANIAKQTGTKMLVRNVPFQANADEIKELFKVFGELKGVRLPKKMVGDEKHRGFAFVEFYTKKEAKRAFKALCQSTHLYGRRLVLEWAQTTEAVEDMRKRTANHFHQESTKRSNKGTLNPESIGLDAE